MKNSFRLWDKVDVQLHNGQLVKDAKVTAIDETTSGTKIRIRHGAIVNYVNADQVVAIRRTA